MARKKIKPDDVEIGDNVFFPNSRHAQEVTRITKAGKSITLFAGTAQWVIGALGIDVEVVDDGE